MSWASSVTVRTYCHVLSVICDCSNILSCRERHLWQFEQTVLSWASSVTVQKYCTVPLASSVTVRTYCPAANIHVVGVTCDHSSNILSCRERYMRYFEHTVLLWVSMIFTCLDNLDRLVCRLQFLLVCESVILRKSTMLSFCCSWSWR